MIRAVRELIAIGLVVLLAWFLLTLAAKPSRAHDLYHGWKIPGTTSSCCNEKKTVDGETTGDCYPTRAEVRNGVWWALRDNGKWIEIPDFRIVNEPNPDPTGEAGHLCINEMHEAVLCFRPPNTGI